MSDDIFEEVEHNQPLVALDKLARDVRAGAALIGQDEARFIVGLYYNFQGNRIALSHQKRTLEEAEKPAEVVTHFAVQMAALEAQMRGVLDTYSDASVVGRWSKDQLGIGPVLAAGLLAHIDIAPHGEQLNTVAPIWRFAGLDPTVVWGKGQKRPWNADLKLLCWKIGDCFVKVSGRENAVYGQLYKKRKAYEVDRNESGGNATRAASLLATKDKASLERKAIWGQAKLPAGHIDLQARRWVVKIFLAHWFQVAYEDRWGVAPPAPYPIAILGHADPIPVPPGGDR